MNRVVTSLLLLASLVMLSSSTAQISGQAGTIGAFTDVSGEGVWATAIHDLAADGYVRGRAPGEFAPQAAVTQAEMAVLLVRAAHGPTFEPPASSGDWWQTWAETAENDGLMPHMTNPDAPATRAEVATLMWLSMHHLP